MLAWSCLGSSLSPGARCFFFFFLSSFFLDILGKPVGRQNLAKSAEVSCRIVGPVGKARSLDEELSASEHQEQLRGA